MLIVTKHSTKYSNRNGTIPAFHYLLLYFPYFRHQNIYISTYLYFLQLYSLYFFNKLKLKGVGYAKRTITIQKSLYVIKSIYTLEGNSITTIMILKGTGTIRMNRTVQERFSIFCHPRISGDQVFLSFQRKLGVPFGSSR